MALGQDIDEVERPSIGLEGMYLTCCINLWRGVTSLLHLWRGVTLHAAFVEGVALGLELVAGGVQT